MTPIGLEVAQTLLAITGKADQYIPVGRQGAEHLLASDQGVIANQERGGHRDLVVVKKDL